MKRKNRGLRGCNRRRHERRGGLRGMVVLGNGARSASLTYRLIDLSRGGLCMVSRGAPSPLREGDAVSCRVKVRAHRPVRVRLTGRVAWVRPWDKRKATILGIRFQRADPSAKAAVRDLLRKRPSDWGVVVL